MTEAEVKKIVAEAVSETLLKLGIEADDPLEVQRDHQFLRGWRQSTEKVKDKSIATAVALVVSGFLGLIYMAFKGN